MPKFDRPYLIKYALEGYNNPLDFNQGEFKRDFTMFLVTRKMARRFVLKGLVNHKLLLNNIIICLNVFRNREGKCHL